MSYSNNSDKYKHLEQYARDLRGESNTPQVTPPDVPYTDDYPTCASCNRPFFYDDDERKYRCNFCIITVRADDIQFSHHNKNRLHKDLAERAAMSAEEQRQENIRTSEIINRKARLATQTGADHESGSPAAGSGGSSGTGGGRIFQIADIHEHARRINARESKRYADHTRSSIREKSTGELHPLDVSLQRELGNKVQITKSFEVNNRQPNSPSIVNKSVRGGEHKPYSRYGDSANPDYKDPYDDDDS